MPGFFQSGPGSWPKCVPMDLISSIRKQKGLSAILVKMELLTETGCLDFKATFCEGPESLLNQETEI